VADRAAFTAYAADVAEQFGRVNVVVNNAGVALAGDVGDLEYPDMDWIIGINFWGVVHGTKAFLPKMIEQDSGTIVNTSSIFGMIAWPTHGTYAASKFAVRGFTEALRHELAGTGVRTLAVHPGGVDTDIVKRSRFYVDDTGRTDKDTMQAEFHKITMTSPEKAATRILSALDKGKERVMVGPDAVGGDRLVRLVPVRYFRVIRFFQRFAR
jgi:short-subunit dehydrogenase